MNIIAWLLFGLIVGIIAHIIDPADARQGGLIGTVLLGLLGALVGGFLGNLFFGVEVTGFNVTSFIVAVAGSLIVLFTQRALMRRL